MGENTTEYLTIQHCSSMIQTAVQSDLVDLSGRLLTCGMITATQSAQLRNTMHGESKRASDMVGFVLSRVSGDKESYSLFINDVLGANRRFYCNIIEQLQLKYSEIEAKVPTEQPKLKPSVAAYEDRVQSDFPGAEVDNGTGDGLKPKYGQEKLDEIQESKAPDRKLKEGDKHYGEVQQFAQEVVLLIQVVNENETWAGLEYMEGPKFSKDQQLPKPVNFGKSKVRLGMFSQYKVALVQTGMGANCEKKLRDALSELPNVKGIIALGIAWGCKGKCELADVLVATKIVGWNEEKWSNGKLIAREKFYVPMTDIFQEVFADLPGQWRNFERAEKIKSKAQKALIISTAKLINDDKMRSQVLAQEPEAKGGEMEGHVLVQKIRRDRPDLHIAVVKGISDFADGNKHDEWQLTAAMAAVNYAKYMLDKTDLNELFD